MAKSDDENDARFYHRLDLVSDLPGQARHQDPNLANPWGIAFSANGPFWIADNHSGVSTVYDAEGNPQPPGHPLVVTIPPPIGGMPPAAPTGIVFNSTNSFQVGANAPAAFIFSTEDGTISGWNPNVDLTHAILKIDQSGSGAVYKGLAIAGSVLYATNFSKGTVDMFDGNFNALGSFTDPTVPAGFAPFGIRNINGHLLVTFAKQDAAKHDDVAGPGNGFVDSFSPAGALESRLISQGALNSPWGLAVAPASFGALSNTLLVGNFGDGTIHGYDLKKFGLAGTVMHDNHKPLEIPGLWALTFGNGAQGGSVNILYFTAGIPGPRGQVEDHGLFGAIIPKGGESQDKGPDDDHDNDGQN